MSLENESRVYSEIAKIRNGRKQLYGAAESNFQMVADMWSAYTGAKITREDIGFMMAMLKACRYKGGDKNNIDNFVDGANYIALAGDMANPCAGGDGLCDNEIRVIEE
jgi:hypothetical protein